jgi:general secretion pathway protein J
MNKNEGGRRREVGGLPQSSNLIPQAAGFTLLEVLLALAILAVIVTTIYGSFSTAADSAEWTEEVRDRNDLARTLIARLANDVANAYIISGTTGTTETFFRGIKNEDEETKQRFDDLYLTTLTNYYGRRPNTKETELWEVGYHFVQKPEGKGRVLLRWEKRELSKDVPPMEGGDDSELTDEVEGLQLRYFDGSNWVDDWDSRQRGHRWPRLVEIMLSLADGKVYVTRTEAGKL